MFRIPFLSIALSTALGLLITQGTQAQTDGVSIDYSVTPTREPKAILQLNSTDQGLIIPRMNATQRGNINPPATAEGMMVYQTDAPEGYYFWDGAVWLYLASSTGSGFIENRNPNGVFNTGQTANLDVTGSGEIGGTLAVNGNVGIGSLAPTANLQIGNTNIGTFNGIAIGATANRDLRIGQDATHNVIVGWKYNATAANAYSIVETYGGSNPLVLQSSGGNVGIRNSSPDAGLTVGDGSASYPGYVRIYRDDNPHIQLIEGTTIAGSRARIQGNVVSTHPQLQITNDNGATSYFNVNHDDGRVGIGTTDPNTALEVKGAGLGITTNWDPLAMQLNLYDSRSAAINVGAGIGFTGNYTGTTPAGLASIWGGKENATANNYASYLGFATRANGEYVLEKMRITSDGNVGIGETVPTARLHVAGGDIKAVYPGADYPNKSLSTFHFTTNPGTDKIVHGLDFKWYSEYARMGVRRGTSTNIPAFVIGVNQLEPDQFVIKSNGNVGIGETNPASKLDVAGNVTADNIWMKIGEVDLTNSTGHVFTGLNGNNQKKYKVVFEGDLNTGGSDRRILIRPNSVSTNYRCYAIYNGTSGGSDWDYTGFYVGRNGWSVDADISFEYTISTATGRNRVGYGNATFYMPSGTRILGFNDTSGAWENTVTNITSLQVLPSGGSITGKLMLFALQ